MSGSIDLIDILLLGMALADASMAGINFANGDVLWAVALGAASILLGAMLIWSWWRDIRKEKDWYQREMGIMEDRVERFQALSSTLVGVLDADPVPVDLETNEEGAVVVTDLREGDTDEH